MGVLPGHQVVLWQAAGQGAGGQVQGDILQGGALGQVDPSQGGVRQKPRPQHHPARYVVYGGAEQEAQAQGRGKNAILQDGRRGRLRVLRGAKAVGVQVTALPVQGHGPLSGLVHRHMACQRRRGGVAL